MKVTWVGHSCFFLQPARHRLLIDPGEFSAPADAAPLDQLACDFALLAHGHDDHSGLCPRPRNPRPQGVPLTPGESFEI